MEKATLQKTRVHNLRLVLKVIYDRGKVSRADIARATRLTRTAVSDVVSELMKEGLVTEVGIGPSAGGKPPILLSILDDSRQIIGVDLAESEFRGAVINLRGKVKHRITVPVQQWDGEAALSVVYDLLDRLIDAAESPILGIGIGTPGLMDVQRGVVLNAVNLDWHNLPLRDLLGRRYNLPIYVANDSQAAAMAECTFGGCREEKNLVLIKIGRGVGAGIVIGRELYYGDGFGAGEIGHVKVVEEGELCRCGHRGCLETVVSVPAIVRHVRELFPKRHASLDFEDVVELFRQGNPEAYEVVSESARYLGIAVANVIGVLNIRRVVFAGEVARLGSLFTEMVKREVEMRVLASLADSTEIYVSALGKDIVELGAAALLMKYELGLP